MNAISKFIVETRRHFENGRSTFVVASNSTKGVPINDELIVQAVSSSYCLASFWAGTAALTACQDLPGVSVHCALNRNYSWDANFERLFCAIHVIKLELTTVSCSEFNLESQAIVSCQSPSEVLFEARECWRKGEITRSGQVASQGLFNSEVRAYWMAEVLQTTAELTGFKSRLIDRCINIARHKSQWAHGKSMFNDIRSEVLSSRNKTPIKQNSLLAAECISKVLFNQSWAHNMFDHDSGWYILPIIYDIARGMEAIDEFEARLFCN